MNTNSDFDPFATNQSQPPEPTVTTKSAAITEEARRIQARAAAFRDIADRFYMLWWNLPEMTHRQVDHDLQDLFRMFMELAPSLGVSRSGIPELRECCGRKRSWKDVAPLVEPAKPQEPELGWCPGDIIRRITRFLGFAYCEKCDKRRRALNRFFRCGQ